MPSRNLAGLERKKKNVGNISNGWKRCTNAKCNVRKKSASDGKKKSAGGQSYVSYEKKNVGEKSNARKRSAGGKRRRAEQIEALLKRDAFRESVHYMSGVEFENFMAKVFNKKGYQVQTTPTTGDQGVDLLVNIDDRKVAVQLKRYTAPVGNAAVQAVVAGMFHYKAREAWLITTSSFTKGAVELAKSNRVRLIEGRELEDWLDDLRDEA